MKVFGHPLHLVVIHFPSALLPMDFVCSLIAYNGGPVSFLHAAFFAAVGAVLFGCLAIITGAFDLMPVVKKKPASINKVLLHGGINTTVLLGFAVMTYLSYKQYPDLQVNSWIQLIVKGFLVLLLMSGNYFGGSLILKDKIAVETGAD